MSKRVLFYLLLFCFISLFVLDLFLGSVNISFPDIIKTLVTGHNSNHELEVVILDFRLPKALAAILAGIALSVSGLQMQTVFRNPLAGPDVLGISSGASLGVALLVLGLPSFFTSNISSILGNWALIIAACVGAAVTLFIILIISSRVRDIMTILILGIMIGAAISSVVSILQYFGSESLLKSFVVWTLGSLGNISKLQIGILSSCIALGLTLSFISVKKLDALLLGEKYAFTMGLNLKRTRLLIFISTSILAGSTTAFCGPIAFIGIAIPHICRIIFKTSEHRILLFATVIAGATILLLCDIISQLPGSNLTIPINSVTALIGIPIVIWIITRNRKQNQW
jgi:iron complex transport system permease protein